MLMCLYRTFWLLIGFSIFYGVICFAANSTDCVDCSIVKPQSQHPREVQVPRSFLNDLSVFYNAKKTSNATDKKPVAMAELPPVKSIFDNPSQMLQNPPWEFRYNTANWPAPAVTPMYFFPAYHPGIIAF